MFNKIKPIMKTSLLLILALAIGISVSAQKAAKFTPVNKAKQAVTYSEIIEQGLDNPAVLPDYQRRTTKSSNTVSKVLFGSSRNIFTSLVQEQNCMTYNKDLDVIMATFRGNDKGTILPLGTGNDICTSWSTDHGDSFTSKIALSLTANNLFRYPSGVIFNPAGNTSVNTAFSVVAGPRTATAWDFSYLSSVQYDGNNFDVQQPATSTYKELLRQGMTACTDGKVHIATMKYATDYKTTIGLVYNGTFNTNTFAFDWTPVDVPLSFNVAPDGTFDAAFGYANMAWNKDGSIGYLMFRGVDSRSTDSKGFYPVLYKSVDQGATWQLMDYFDFSIFPVVFDHIWSTYANPDKAVPFFNEADLVVDAAGNPHIFSVCQGQYSQHPDSLGYTFLYEVPSVFEFSFEHGEWFCHYIDHLKTRDVSAANSPYVYSPDNVGWDMRLQASRTDDGNKVFGLWTDTDWEFWSLTDSLNLYPDVMMWGRDINTNLNTDVKNVTFLEEGMGEAYFMFVSSVAMDNAGVYDVPLTIEDINTTGLQAIEPVYHYFLKGASFSEADFINPGGTEKPRVNGLTVTNFPNPFSGKTSINITLDQSAPVSLVVNSLTGQQVSKVNFGLLGSGPQTLTFDGSNLSSGVYFYTLTIGEQKVTNKMVVK